MSNETKRNVFGQLLNAYQNLIMKDIEIPEGSYRANITTPWNIVYDDALPDDLQVIPKEVGEYIEDAKASHYELLDAMTKWTLDQPVFDWIHDNSDTFARAWVLGVWKVKETDEVVKL
jgi:hypothetical protein